MIRMNDSMNIEQYQPAKTWMFRFAIPISCALALATGNSGCRGTAPSFSQAFNSFGAPARVPPPAQGSFQVPNSFSGGSGTATSPASNGLGSSSFSNGPRTSQNTMPASNLFNSISNAQSQIRSATNNARNSVNRAADGLNSSVEQASARLDRVGQGVSQASAILSEAATAPIVSAQDEMPTAANHFTSAPSINNNSLGTSGRIGDSDPTDNGNWKTPIKQ